MLLPVFSHYACPLSAVECYVLISCILGVGITSFYLPVRLYYEEERHSNPKIIA